MKADLDTLKRGQKVRISFEAKFCSVTDGCVIFDRGNSWGIGSLRRTEGLEVEVIEPVYVEAGIYQAANGTVWARAGIAWIKPGRTARYPHDAPIRPLVRLVPEVAG